MKAHILEVHDFPENVFLVYKLSTQGKDELPIGHAIHRSAYGHRTLTEGYDVDHKDFHQLLTEHFILESLFDHPEMQGVHGPNHERAGQVHDIKAAREACEVVWEPHHLTALQKAVPNPHHHVEKLRRIVGDPLCP